ncbi:MAG: TauD/TfdA family dioxygenase [Proteobacteria bacterium]|nr:TauD/TfdA family dioxygenase [Pseudomonadota bacterium]MDA1357846.1 TauD/TfdA family dioxygenase [Pseudomonadota bacterium]
MALDIRKLTPGFGAEIRCRDLSHLGEIEFGAVRDLWIEHGILLFRGQELDEESQVAFSRRFGALEIHVRTEYLSPEFPEVLLVSNLQKPDGAPLGILADRDVGWHYDQIYLAQPALGSMLHAVKVPPEGGRTYFADMAAVYAALPDDLKRRIEGRRAVQSYEHFNRSFSVPTSKSQKVRTQDLSHPMVRTHPYSKRKSLYVCPGMTTEILGLEEAESREILDRLFEFSVRPEFVYGHDWRAGDSILWDNARSMHRRDPFDACHQRLMKRTTILLPDALAVPS